MKTETNVDVTRLIRIATAAGAVLAGALVYLAREPDVDALANRLDAARVEERSDDAVIAETERLRAERDTLGRRYAGALGRNAEAVFLRDIGNATRRHGVAVVSTSANRTVAPAVAGDPLALFTRVDFTIELRGTYRALLATVVDLSLGNEIARVAAPSLRRDRGTLVASVPVTLYEPARP